MPSAPGRILVVDDERPLLRMLSLYLGRLGYSVTTAETTDAAWKLVEAGPAAFTVAVLDGSMSGMSMDDLALRMLRTDPALRVLAASGYPVDMTALAEAAPGRDVKSAERLPGREAGDGFQAAVIKSDESANG